MSARPAIDQSDPGDGRTVFGDTAAATPGYAELTTLFSMLYEDIRREHRAERSAGLLTLAFDLGSATLASRQWIKTRPDAINALTVGRHRACDLCLPRDPTLSLRHLTLVTHPRPDAQRTRPGFRVLDLRTSLGFHDCFGLRLPGVIADGPALITLGRYALLALPTGEGCELPATASAGWSAIADPIYLEQASSVTLVSSISELRAGAGARKDGRPAQRPATAPLAAGDDLGHRTSFSVIEGPLRASAGLLGPGEEPLGTLEVNADGRSQTLAVGARAARQGLLLGSYERCDDAVLAHLQGSAISRVHLLLWLHEDTLYAIDTASTNGTFASVGNRRVRARIVRMSSGLELVLGEGRALLRWTAID